jgi:protoporphyrin/coproporphyrin ferrochelatase
MTTKPWALVVLNMGGPDSMEAVEPFLVNLLSDPELVRLPFPMRLFQKPFARFAAKRRLEHASHGYEDMGGSSPLLCHTTLQAEGIARELGALGVPARPFVAMRYWHPFAAAAASAIRALDPEGVILLSLYPQFSPATGGSSIDDMRRALDQVGFPKSNVMVIDRYPELPGYVEAMAASVRRGLAEMGSPAPHVLFSAHGLPQAYIDRGDPYQREILATYAAVRAALDPGLACSIAYQSRVGPREWLRPYTEDEIADLARRGVRRLLMVPLGFVSDHIETLHEMDHEYAGVARKLGMEFHRVPALNDDPVFMKALAGLLRERLNGKV